MAETNEARILRPEGLSVARIDKWLWAARIFKTRSIAADAIKNGRVTIQGVNVKPSRMVKAGEVVSVRKPPVTYSFKILKTIEQRVGAKLIPEIYENVTTPDQYEPAGDEPHQRVRQSCPRYGTSHEEGTPCAGRVRGTGYGG